MDLPAILQRFLLQREIDTRGYKTGKIMNELYELQYIRRKNMTCTPSDMLEF
jgi:hypothetical protein